MFNMQDFQNFMEMWQAYQVFQQMQQPQPNPQLAAPTPSQQTSGAVEIIHNNKEVEDLRKQIADLEAQLAAAKLEIQSLTEQRETIRHEAEEREGELRNLKVEMSKVEAFHGQSWSDLLEEIEATSGDDYYEQHRKEWYTAGCTNYEMHDMVKAFCDSIKPDEKIQGTVGPDFEDEARLSPHTTEEKVSRAKEELKRGHLTGFMEEIRDNGFDKGGGMIDF